MSAPGMAALQRRSVYTAGAVLFLSGAAWLALHYLGGAREALDSAMHAAQAWALRVHGAAASAVLVVLGSVLATHVPAAWANRVNAATGLAVIAVVLVLAVTGWALYYAGDEALRTSVSALHWALGLAAAPLLAVHARKRQAGA